MSTKTLSPKARCVVLEEQHLRLAYDIHTNAKTPAFHMHVHIQKVNLKRKRSGSGEEWREGRRGNSEHYSPEHYTYKALATRIIL